MSHCTPSSFSNSKRFAAKMSTAKARFVDGQSGADAFVDEDLRQAAADLLGMERAASNDADHHLIYVSGGRILHVAYAEAHDRVYGPSADCDDVAFTSWWVQHRAWRRALVSTVAYSNNAEDTLAFFAVGNDAKNPYPTPPLPPSTSQPAGASEICADEKTADDRPPGRIRLLCPSCQSADVMRDAYARWSVAKHAWELAEVFDFMVCEACETETRNLLVVHDEAST